MSDYDVIGSGSGGLGAALARAGRRVAVFDQHTVPGECDEEELLTETGQRLRIYPAEDPAAGSADAPRAAHR